MKKLHKLRGLFSQDPQNEIHKLDEQIMFFDDVWGSAEEEQERYG